MEKLELNESRSKCGTQTSVIPQYVAAFIVNISGICNGVLLAWPAIAIPLLQSSDSPIGGDPLTNEDVSLIASLVCVAAAISVPIFTIIRAKIGNKITGYIVGIVYSINWIIIVSTSSLTCIYIARVIGGIGAAGIFILCPQYVSEIAEDKVRGTLGVFFAALFNVGYLFTNAIAAFVGYRTIAIIGLALTVIFMVSFYWMPETPRHLLTQGKVSEANSSLQWLRGKKADVTEEMTRLKNTLKIGDDEETMTFREMFSDKGTRYGLLISVVLCINCQLCGVFAILSYLVSIFIEAGSTLSPNTASVIVGTLQVTGTIIASFFVDRTGRRLLLMISNIAMAVCLIALGSFFYLKHLQYDVSNIGWIPVTSLSTFMVAISIGLGPLPFVILTEICLPSVTKFATTLGYCILWSISFLTSQFFSSVSDLIGIYGCYWFFSLTCIAGAVFVYFVIPETKGRPIEEIHRELCGDRRPVRETSKNYKYTTPTSEA